MKTIAVRIKQGEDLVEAIEKIIAENDIQAGIILSGVGGLTKAKFRLPVISDQPEYIYPENLEIVSMTGTVSQSGIHIHISGSDVEGKVWGGHLKQGSIVRMTCELVIGVLEDTVFERKPDDETGYHELTVRPASE